jgi:osmoprotectant transport system substrate-binding protein
LTAIRKEKKHVKLKTLFCTLAVLALTLALAACGNVSNSEGGGDGGGPTITVGSKNFTEQLVLAELYAQVLEEEGFNVERKLDLGSVQIADRALQNGQIDFYPEYTGTALVTVLGYEGENPKTPEATYEEAKQRYAQRDPADTMLKPANYESTYGILVRREVAEKLDLKTLEDLAEASPQLVFASFGEFQERSDGFPNMKRNYPNLNFKDIIIVNDIGLRYKGLETGEADVGIGFTTDRQFDSGEFVVMEDLKQIWPYYYPAPVVRSDVLEENPRVEEILNRVSENSPGIETMRELIGRVDIEQEDPEDVAREYLQEKGLVQ